MHFYSFRIEDLQHMLRDMYPGIMDEHDKFEHPMTAVGVVLLSAAMLRTVNRSTLMKFTGYSSAFISAIDANMRENRLWVDGSYDTSAWLLETGVEQDQLWENIEFACGLQWVDRACSNRIVDTCGIYWDERGSFG